MEKKETDVQILNKMISNEDKDTSNSRKIPKINFLENVEEWVNKYTAEKLLEGYNQYLNKFRYMEGQISKHQTGIKEKIPDLEKALESIVFLEKKQKGTELNVDYMVSNNLWAKADVKVEDSVYLWLGANIMCEYTMSEAKEVLNSNLQKAKTNIKVDEQDLDYVRDQITVCEVNIARVYNENVKRKQAQKKK